MGQIHRTVPLMELVVFIPNMRDYCRNYLIPLKGNMTYWSLLASVGNPTFYRRDGAMIFSPEGEPLKNRFGNLKSRFGHMVTDLLHPASEVRETMTKIFLNSDRVDGSTIVELPEFGKKSVIHANLSADSPDVANPQPEATFSPDFVS